MANTRIVGRPIRFRSPHHPPLALVRRPLICWPAVAVAAIAGAVLVVGVLIGLARLPARTARPVRVAVAAPTAGDPVSPLLEAPAAPTADPTPPSPSAATTVPDPVPSPNHGDEGASFRPIAPRRILAAPAADSPPAPAAATCQTFGTSVDFVASPAAAAKQAVQDGKLLFLLHVSGDFEDDAFT